MSKQFEGPTYRYDPETGEGRVFTDAADVPKGWLDHVPARKPITREEIIAALTDGGIKFDAKAKTEALLELLVKSVHATLDESKTEFDPKADVRDLLHLLGA